MSGTSARYTDQDFLNLRDDDLLEWIDQDFLTREPFAFRNHDWEMLRLRVSAHLSSDLLRVEPHGVFLTGSGAVGLSLHPNKLENGQLKVFNDDSDFDLALVSAEYFETAWRDLRRVWSPALRPFDGKMNKREGRQRKKLFDGVILTTEVLGSVSFGKRWLAGKDRIADDVTRMLDRQVVLNMWLYKDYWSLRNYIAKGVVECHRNVAEQGGI